MTWRRSRYSRRSYVKCRGVEHVCDCPAYKITLIYKLTGEPETLTEVHLLLLI